MVDPFVGRQIGNCVLSEKLGTGGMAVVYKAHQPSLGRDVAVKILTGPLATDEEFVQRFRREAMVAGSLGHPNLLTIFDAGTTEDGLHYIIMEYAPGGTLKDLLKQRRLSSDQATDIAAQIAEALHAAHDQGIVHRDLKPSNILFSRDGRPLLMDFGIALSGAATRLTRTGVAVGTPEYMSPEQAQGQPVDLRSDLYSLGVLLHEMLTRDVPFVGDTPLATLYQHVHSPFSEVALNSAGVPPWLRSVIERCLAKDPSDRFASASGLASALRQEQVPMAAAPATVASPAATARPSVGPREVSGRRRRPVLWLSAIVVAIAVIVLVTRAVFFQQPAQWTAPTAVLVADTSTPVAIDTQPQTSTAIAMAIGTREAKEAKETKEANETQTALANAEAELTRVAQASAATSAAMTAQASHDLSATGTADAAMQATADAGEAEAAATLAAWRDAEATSAAATQTAAAAAQTSVAATAAWQQAATATADAIATQQPPATSTPVPAAVLFARAEMGQDDVFVRRGSVESNLTNHAARDWAAAWSPDGRLIAFVSDRDGNPDIFVMEADGSNPRNLTNDPGFDSAPAWSPDGRWIAFHSGRTGLFQLWAVRSDGSEQRHFLQSGQHDYNPEWSPDGTRIAFYRTVDTDNYEIMVTDRSGGDVQRLTHEPGWDYFPRWSPNGTQIVFASRREGGDADRFYVMNADGSDVKRLAGSVSVLYKVQYPWVATFNQ